MFVCVRSHFKNFVRYMNSSNRIEHLEDLLKQKFSKLHAPDYYDRMIKKCPRLKELKRASVLIPITILPNGSKTVFTLSKRANTLNSFPGQVAFLGGRKDENVDKDDVMTAFREAKEEAGVEEHSLTLLAQLCPFISSNLTLVTPVVALFDKSQFIPRVNFDEVEIIFELDTERFVSLNGYRNETKVSIFDDSGYLVHYFDDNVILENQSIVSVTTWGFTAFLSCCVACVIHSKIAPFPLVNKSSVVFNIDNLNEFLEAFLFDKLAVLSPKHSVSPNKSNL
jgi:8-oxo-dGTP pyrophosphatase MutT (NUDIX family)